MRSPVQILKIIRYYRDKRPWDSIEIKHPAWKEVENAIRQMDNYYFPIVQLNLTDNEEDETIFNIIGGDGKFALFHMMGEWQYEDPDGGSEEVMLWESDQGYFCEAKNILTDIEKALRITKVFYETGSYNGLDNVE